MDCQTVLDSLRRLTDLTPRQAEEAIPLCAAVSEEISLRLRPDADREDARLDRLGAAMVCYRLTLRRANERRGEVRYRAGDVDISLSTVEDIQSAKMQLDEYLKAAAPLLKDEEFSVRAVGP